MSNLDLAAAVDQYATRCVLLPIVSESLGMEELDYNAYVAKRSSWTLFHQDIEESGFLWGVVVCLDDPEARRSLSLAILRHCALSDHIASRIGPLEYLASVLVSEEFLRTELDGEGRLLFLRLIMAIIGKESTESSDADLGIYSSILFQCASALEQVISEGHEA